MDDLIIADMATEKFADRAFDLLDYALARERDHLSFLQDLVELPDRAPPVQHAIIAEINTRLDDLVRRYRSEDGGEKSWMRLISSYQTLLVDLGLQRHAGADAATPRR